MKKAILKFIFAILILFVCFGGSAKAQWTPHIDSVASQVEIKYNLPHGICHAFNMQENSGKVVNPPTRVEPGFYNEGEPHYKEVMNSTILFFKNNPEMVDTLPFDVERYQESTSWGWEQLMGMNLRQLGCTEDFLSEITPEEHFEYFGRFIANNWHKYHSIPKLCKFYNGPKVKQSYINHITKYLKQYGGQ